MVVESVHAPRRGRRSSMKRAAIAVAALVVIALVVGGCTIFAWTIDETHFDRPSAEFDELTAEIESLPGVGVVEHERWVEAPSFSDPTSSILLDVDQRGLPGVLGAACSRDYPDAVAWGLRVRTEAGTLVSVHGTDGESRCPDFGFDVVRLVAEVDRVAPGTEVQPTIWDDRTLTLVELTDSSAGYSHLLPLIAHSADLVRAAGLDPDQSIEINSLALGATIKPGESGAYVSLLSTLAEHGVTDFWTSGSGQWSDGVEKVLIGAPERQHAAIERAVADSGLDLARIPVEFLPR